MGANLKHPQNTKTQKLTLFYTAHRKGVLLINRVRPAKCTTVQVEVVTVRPSRYTPHAARGAVSIGGTRATSHAAAARVRARATPVVTEISCGTCVCTIRTCCLR